METTVVVRPQYGTLVESVEIKQGMIGDARADFKCLGIVSVLVWDKDVQVRIINQDTHEIVDNNCTVYVMGASFLIFTGDKVIDFDIDTCIASIYKDIPRALTAKLKLLKNPIH